MDERSRRYFSSSFVLYQRDIFMHAFKTFRGNGDTLRNNMRILKEWCNAFKWNNKPTSYVLELVLIYIYADFYARDKKLLDANELYDNFERSVKLATKGKLGIATFFDGKKLVPISCKVPKDSVAYVQDIANMHMNAASLMAEDSWTELLDYLKKKNVDFQ